MAMMPSGAPVRRRLRRVDWIVIGSISASYILPLAVIGVFSLCFPEASGAVLSRLELVVNDSSWPLAIAISLIPIIVTPLTHAPVAILIGSLWVPVAAVSITWAAKFIGNCVNFALGRLLGPAILNRFTSESDRAELNLIARRHAGVIFAMYAVPPVANDTLSYFLGAVRMNFLTFVRISFFAHLGPAITWTAIGSVGKQYGLGFAIATFAIVTILGLAAWRFINGRGRGVSVRED